MEFNQEKSRGSSKIKNYGKLLKLETKVLELTIYGMFGVNKQLLSWPLLYMIKTPNQVDLNMDFVLLPPSFKEVPRLKHLGHYSSSMVVWSRMFQIHPFVPRLRNFLSIPSQDSRACSWQFFRTLRVSSQLISNMKFIVLSLPFPLIPRASHLDHHSSRYHSHKSWPWFVWVAFVLSELFLSFCSFQATYFMPIFHKVPDLIGIQSQHESCRALSPLHFLFKHFHIW